MSVVPQPAAHGAPLAEIADLLPQQGAWSVGAFRWLSEQTERRIEYNNGYIEILPMPTKRHEAIVRVLLIALDAVLRRIGGAVYGSNLHLYLPSGQYRRPDLVAVLDVDDPRAGDDFFTGADLVVEVISPDDPGRDTTTKRTEYAACGIPEYWLVDPRDETITVLTLRDGAYQTVAQVGRDDVLTSVVLPEFRLAVAAVFDAR